MTYRDFASWLSPPSSSSSPTSSCCVKYVKEVKHAPSPLPLLLLFVLYIPQSNNNLVKHAKPLKSPARDLGSCSALEPGRCKRREDLCNSGLVLPRVHTHTKRRGRKKRNVKSDWINNVCFSVWNHQSKYATAPNIDLFWHITDLHRNITLFSVNKRFLKMFWPVKPTSTDLKRWFFFSFLSL